MVHRGARTGHPRPFKEKIWGDSWVWGQRLILFLSQVKAVVVPCTAAVSLAFFNVDLADVRRAPSRVAVNPFELSEADAFFPSRGSVLLSLSATAYSLRAPYHVLYYRSASLSQELDTSATQLCQYSYPSRLSDKERLLRKG